MEGVCIMGKKGRFDFRELEKLQKQMEKLKGEQNQFCQECAKELAARLLRQVIKRTPSDTGNLRRGWTAQRPGSGAEGMKTRGASQFVDTLSVHRFDDTYVIEIVNPVEYASYVEYGHRTADHTGWVNGKFMLTISEKELQAVAPKILERKLESWLKGAFHA